MLPGIAQFPCIAIHAAYATHAKNVYALNAVKVCKQVRKKRSSRNGQHASIEVVLVSATFLRYVRCVNYSYFFKHNTSISANI